jgi:hypothetical protein
LDWSQGAANRRLILRVSVLLVQPSLHLLKVHDDFEVAEATYRAAVARWPAARSYAANIASGA